MPAYVIAHIDVKDPARYEEYKKMAPSSIAAYGGRYIARGGQTRVLEGSWTPRRLVILEFPSFAQASAWWESQQYAPAKAVRQSCAAADLVLIDGI